MAGPLRVGSGWRGRGRDTIYDHTAETGWNRDGASTRVHLEHRDLPDPEKPGHAEGWKHYLARLAVAGTGDPGPDPGMQPVLKALKT